MTKEANDSSLQLPDSLGGLQTPLMIGGGVALLVGVIAGTMSSNGISHSLHAYLTAFTYCLTISLGAFFFVLMQHLCRAGWSASVRRIAEILMAIIPLMGLMFLPILFWVLFLDHGALYPWRNADWSHTSDMHHEKAKLLNPIGFLLVTAVVWGLWTMVVRFYWTNSRLQDQTGDVALSAKMQKWSGPATMVFALSVSAAAFLWIMSLDPLWFSTMFGVYLFAGSMLSFFGLLGLLVYKLQKNGAIVDEVNEEHFHDIGKFAFGFVVFWAYIAFSQYMLIWYGNIPEETEWLMHRQSNADHELTGWAFISIALVLLHWLVPFFALMSRHVRRWPKWMAFWGVYVLVMHYVDMYWVIMPEAGISHSVLGGPMGAISSVLCVLGMVGLYFGAFFRIATGIPLIPVKDPRLSQALKFENI